MEPDWKSADKRHQEAQALAAKAAKSIRDGDVHDSRLLYRRAGEVERLAFELIPSDRPRTLGIIAVSVVALFYKSASYQEARIVAITFLEDSNLPKFCHDEIKEILLQISEEVSRFEPRGPFNIREEINEINDAIQSQKIRPVVQKYLFAIVSQTAPEDSDRIVYFATPESYTLQNLLTELELDSKAARKYIEDLSISAATEALSIQEFLGLTVAQ